MIFLCLDATIAGIDPSIFIDPHTFHLTVQMLKLWNTDRVVQAALVLQVRRSMWLGRFMYRLRISSAVTS